MHIRNIFKEREFEEKSACKDYLHTTAELVRKQNHFFLIRVATSAERYCNEEQYYGGLPAHLKQRKISVLRLSLYIPNNCTASTFYNTQSSYD